MVFLILSVFLPPRPVLCVNEDFLENWLIEMCLDKILSFLESYQIIPWIIKNYWYISWNLHRGKYSFEEVLYAANNIE